MPTWEERFDAAEMLGHFTLEDRIAAGTWQTCAVGEICASKGVELKFGLHTGVLYDLGFAFDDAVLHDEITRARNLYRRILQEVP